MKKKSELIIEKIIEQQELEKHNKEEKAFISLLELLGVNIIKTNECIIPNALKELLIKEAKGEKDEQYYYLCMLFIIFYCGFITEFSFYI